MTTGDPSARPDSKGMDRVSSEFARTVSGELQEVATGIYRNILASAAALAKG